MAEQDRSWDFGTDRDEENVRRVGEGGSALDPEVVRQSGR